MPLFDPAAQAARGRGGSVERSLRRERLVTESSPELMVASVTSVGFVTRKVT